MFRVLEKSKGWRVDAEHRKVVQEKSQEWFWEEGGQCWGNREDSARGAGRTVLGGFFLFAFNLLSSLKSTSQGSGLCWSETRDAKTSISGNWGKGHLTKCEAVLIK